MKPNPLLRPAVAALALAAVGGCSTTYSSRDECERAEAAYRGRAIGFLAATAANPVSQTIVRENGVTRVTNHGGANLGTLALGTIAGHYIGGALYERTRDTSPDDVRPYTGNWYGRCAPDGNPGRP